MCDCKQTKSPRSEEVKPLDYESCATMTNTPIRFDAREDIARVIEAYRDRANALQALLDSIPKALTEEAQMGIGIVANHLWKSF